MDKTHAGSPAPLASGKQRKTVRRPMTQLPAGPDYWPMPSQPTATRELASKPTS